MPRGVFDPHSSLFRIEKFSFGDSVAGIIQPLEGEEKITNISKL